MDKERMHKELLHYGEIVKDTIIGGSRLRVIKYEGKCYYDVMINGQIVDLFEVVE